MFTPSDILTYGGFAVGIASLGYALWADRQRKKMSEIIRWNNWQNYQRLNNACGFVQKSYKTYFEQHKDSASPEIVDILARADAHSQEVIVNLVRTISMFEPSFKEIDFQRWKKEGKIGDDKVALFRQLSVAPGDIIEP